MTIKTAVNQLLQAVLKNTFTLLALSNKEFNAGKTVDKLTPIILLMVQEMYLQQLRRDQKRDITDADSANAGNLMQILQANPLAYGLMYLSVQFGYLFATHRDETLALTSELEHAVNERKKYDIKL